MEIKKEKSFAMGIVGALIGSLLGGLSIILLAQAGFVSAISGFVMAFCTLKGFELLGGKLEKKALIVCIAIMAVMPYLADRVSWAIAYVQAFEDYGMELSFGDALGYTYEFLEVDELMGDYIKNLLLVYAFVALGSFTIIKQAFAKKDAPAAVEVLEEDAVIATAEEEDVVVETAAPVEE